MLNFENISIIAPHPDDEILGCGGSIAKFIKNNIQVHILFISGHLPPLYKMKEFLKTQKEAYDALKYLGIKKENIKFLKIPATKISEYPISDLNSKIENFIYKSKSDAVFTCFPDRHIDHKLVFEASMVATRPNKTNFPKYLFLYETLSETHWNVSNIEPSFNPNFFIDITDEIKTKIQGINFYESQIKHNSSRSVEALEALAKFRGSQNGCEYAEAFHLIRAVHK